MGLRPVVCVCACLCACVSTYIHVHVYVYIYINISLSLSTRGVQGSGFQASGFMSMFGGGVQNSRIQKVQGSKGNNQSGGACTKHTASHGQEWGRLACFTPELLTMRLAEPIAKALSQGQFLKSQGFSKTVRSMAGQHTGATAKVSAQVEQHADATAVQKYQLRNIIPQKASFMSATSQREVQHRRFLERALIGPDSAGLYMMGGNNKPEWENEKNLLGRVNRQVSRVGFFELEFLRVCWTRLESLQI